MSKYYVEKVFHPTISDLDLYEVRLTSDDSWVSIHLYAGWAHAHAVELDLQGDELPDFDADLSYPQEADVYP